MSDALLLARETGCANVGTTLDVCHAFMAGESPAMAATLALREQRLIGLHLNDGHGLLDDGLMVASVHWLETLELVITLLDAGWTGTVYFDTFAPANRAAEECRANLSAVQSLITCAQQLDRDQLRSVRAKQDVFAATALARSIFR
jgi:xylose isomerase